MNGWPEEIAVELVELVDPDALGVWRRTSRETEPAVVGEVDVFESLEPRKVTPKDEVRFT